MLNDTSAASSPLDNLDYFVEWGGASWRHLIYHAIHNVLGEAYLRDKAVLDLGTRYGKMAVLFALFEANVTGLDIDEDSLHRARTLCMAW